MLEAFQPIEKLDQLLSEDQPLPTPGSIEYLYYGAYSFFEGIMDIGIIHFPTSCAATECRPLGHSLI